MANGKRVALYLRVSTDGQSVENQRLELEAAAERHGWHVVQTFKDHGISGAETSIWSRLGASTGLADRCST